MSFLSSIDPDRLSPSRIWSALPPEIKRAGATAMVRSDDPSERAEVVAAIAGRMKFRPATVQKLPADKRVEYLAKAVHPDEALASSLLLSFHLAERRPLLAAFLDQLGIANDDGVISEGAEPSPPAEDAVRKAVGVLLERFEPTDVEVYLATLAVMDADLWSGVLPVLRERRQDA